MDTIYHDVLHGRLAPAEAQNFLRSEVANLEVYVTPDVVQAMLEKYLNRQINSQYLTEWADFLITEEVYVTPGWEDDKQADKFERMWEVLQQLAAPFIDGPITAPRVRTYLRELSNIENE